MHGHYLIGKKQIEVFQHPLAPVSAALTTCIIAHELGHHIDIQRMSKEELAIYRLALGISQTLKQDTSRKWPVLRSAIFNAEDRAWSNAFVVLQKIDFPDWEFFFDVREHCLGTYKVAYHIR